MQHSDLVPQTYKFIITKYALDRDKFDTEEFWKYCGSCDRKILSTLVFSFLFGPVTLVFSFLFGPVTKATYLTLRNVTSLWTDRHGAEPT